MNPSQNKKVAPCKIHGQRCSVHNSHAEDGDTVCREARRQISSMDAKPGKPTPEART